MLYTSPNGLALERIAADGSGAPSRVGGPGVQARLSPDGAMAHFAGTLGDPTCRGDGGPAIEAGFGTFRTGYTAPATRLLRVDRELFVVDTDHWRHFFILMGMVWGLGETARLPQLAYAGQLPRGLSRTLPTQPRSGPIVAKPRAVAAVPRSDRFARAVPPLRSSLPCDIMTRVARTRARPVRGSLRLN